MRLIRQTVVVTFALLVLCCGLYPALVTAAAQALFPREANGSLVGDHGSALIAQTFEDPARFPQYFWGRPSAASVDPATSVMVSSGSNYGPLQPALRDDVAARVKLLRDSGVSGPIPVDLVTKSASGLDPHLSPEAMDVQVPRVAKARSMTEAEVRAIVHAHTERSTFGFLGEPRVNVLLVNLELDARRG